TLTATNARQAGNHSFPSGALIRNNVEWPKQDCGKSGCHPNFHREWKASAHARSGQSARYVLASIPFPRASGPDNVRWCDGCHSPLSDLKNDNGTAGGIKSQIGLGIGCTVCHAMAHVTEATGNGRAEYAQPASYKLLGPSTSTNMERFLINL